MNKLKIRVYLSENKQRMEGVESQVRNESNRDDRIG